MPPDLISSASAIQHSTHDRTKRKTRYDSRLNRSLESLEIDEVKLQEKCTKYIHWWFNWKKMLLTVHTCKQCAKCHRYLHY